MLYIPIGYLIVSLMAAGLVSVFLRGAGLDRYAAPNQAGQDQAERNKRSVIAPAAIGTRLRKKMAG